MRVSSPKRYVREWFAYASLEPREQAPALPPRRNASRHSPVASVESNVGREGAMVVVC